MSPRPKTTTPRPSSDPVPGDVLLTLTDLKISIDKIVADEGWAPCPGPHAARVGKSDRHASWSINLNTGQHHCFSCGWGGPFIVLVKFINDWQDEQDKAEEWIRRHGGIEVAKKKLRGDGVFEKESAIPVSEADLALFTDPPVKALNERDVCVESCQAYGVMWDPVKGNWIFPIRDPETNALRGWQAKGKGFFGNYPDHVEKADTVFGYHLLGDTAYLYESPLDAVRLHTYGIEGGVSTYGVHMSDPQLRLICDRVDTLYICLDNDGPGRAKERQIWQDYRGSTRLMFANYSHVSRKQKDHGEMSPGEVEWSLNNAISSLRFRP